AQELERPILLINPGVTRADSLGRRWRANADEALAAISNGLKLSKNVGHAHGENATTPAAYAAESPDSP
ncbi:MAG: hypothetical protein AAF991_11200, partial [Pseudomonadota bacterium]